MDARRLSAGDVAVLSRPDGTWAALIVTAAGAGEVSVCALDRWSAHPPTVADLAAARPLRLDHHLFTGRWAHHTVQATDPVPPSLEWIGRLPVPAAVRDSPNSYASWAVVGHDVDAQRRWDGLDPAVRDAYRAVRSGPSHVDLDFGAGAVSRDPHRTTELDLTDGSIPLPAAGDPHWSALDRLARCTALTWRGADRGLTAALAARPVISRLTWIDPPTEVDLSGTGVADLTIRGSLPARLRLPPGCRGLTLETGAARSGRVTATATADGRWLSLRLVVIDTEPVPLLPDGLEGVREVLILAAGTASVASLAPLAELEQLSVFFQQPPGRLAGADVLAGHARLRVLTINDGYALEAGTLPELPALAHLEIDGVRRSVTAGLRSRCKATGTRLVLRGAKSDLWLAANLDNPLRDWADDDARGGAAACKAYAEAVRAIDKLPADGPDRREQAVHALHTMIVRLNTLDAKHEMIDTVRREEACAAFEDLAGRAGIPPDEATDLCDGWRDW